VTTHVGHTPSSSVRPPLAVRAAALLLVPLALVSTAGLVLFSFVWTDGPIGAGAVFAAFVLATTASAVAALPCLLRGRLEAWAVVTVWSCCYTYWSVYKVFGEREYESAGFLATGLALVALLTSRSARTHAGDARQPGRRPRPRGAGPGAVVADPSAGRLRRVPVRPRRRAPRVAGRSRGPCPPRSERCCWPSAAAR
jgi:hypothetical protein